MSDEHIFEAFEAVNIPKMQTKVYLDLLKNKESTIGNITRNDNMGISSMDSNKSLQQNKEEKYELITDFTSSFGLNNN